MHPGTHKPLDELFRSMRPDFKDVVPGNWASTMPGHYTSAFKEVVVQAVEEGSGFTSPFWHCSSDPWKARSWMKMAEDRNLQRCGAGYMVRIRIWDWWCSGTMDEDAMVDLSSYQLAMKFINSAPKRQNVSDNQNELDKSLGRREILLKWRGDVPIQWIDVVADHNGTAIMTLKEFLDRTAIEKDIALLKQLGYGSQPSAGAQPNPDSQPSQAGGQVARSSPERDQGDREFAASPMWPKPRRHIPTSTQEVISAKKLPTTIPPIHKKAALVPKNAAPVPQTAPPMKAPPTSSELPAKTTSPKQNVGSDNARAVTPNAKARRKVMFNETDPKDLLPDEEKNTELSHEDAPTGSQPSAQPTGTQPSAQPTGSQPNAQPTENETDPAGVTSKAPAIKAMKPNEYMTEAMWFTIAQQPIPVLNEKLTLTTADHIARGCDLADLPTCPKKAKSHEKDATPEAKASSQAAAKAGANAEAKAEEKAAAKAESAAAEAPIRGQVEKDRTISDTYDDAAGQMYEDAKRKHEEMQTDALTVTDHIVYLQCRGIEEGFSHRWFDQEYKHIKEYEKYVDSLAESIQTDQTFSDHDSWKASMCGFDREKENMRRNVRLCMIESDAFRLMLNAQINDRADELAKLKEELLKVATVETVNHLPLSHFSKEAVGIPGFFHGFSQPAYRQPGYGTHPISLVNYTGLLQNRGYITPHPGFNGRKAPIACTREKRVSQDPEFDYVTWWLDMGGFHALSECSYGNWSGAYVTNGFHDTCTYVLRTYVRTYVRVQGGSQVPGGSRVPRPRPGPS